MNIQMNYFDKWITEELLRIRVINTLENIQMVNWFPSVPYDGYSCAIRFKTSIFNNQIVEDSIFDKIDIINNYINVSIGDEILSNKVSSYVIKQADCYGITEFDGMYNEVFAVEHTSQTPSYPINLATFRGSVIGNVVVSMMRKNKIPVSVHYLVADTSRNIDLILENYSIDKIFSWGQEAKEDHLCGVLFCNALSKIINLKQELRVCEMFPCVNKNLFLTIERDTIKEEYSKDDKKKYCEFCIQGHRETLENAHIDIDLYDYETKAIKEVDYDFFVDSEIARRNLSEEKISYLWINCAYYSYLAKKYSTVISVVNNRQEQKINEVLTNLKKDIRFKPLFYGDVKISDNSITVVDSIKNGHFHSVDEYVREASEVISVDRKTICDALKLLLLSKRYSQPISLDVRLFSDLKKYIEIVIFIRSEIDNMKKTNDVSSNDAVLARYLIMAFSIFSIKSIYSPQSSSIRNLNIHKIVAYIEMIVTYMRERYSQSLLINNNIAIACKQVLENAFSLLGI